MNKFLAGRHYLAKMKHIESQLYPSKYLPESAFFDLFDTTPPFIFVYYPQIRLVPFVCLINHDPSSLIQHPFFRSWGQNGNHHMYFGGLPAQILAEIRKNAHPNYSWFDTIQNDHIYFTSKGRIPPEPHHDEIKPRKQIKLKRNLLIMEDTRKESHQLPEYDRLYAGLLYDILEQQTNHKSIRELASKYQGSVGLDALCINNKVFRPDFPYTFTRYCDFKIILVLPKDKANYANTQYPKTQRIHQLKNHQQAQLIRTYLIRFAKHTELIHHYECEQSEIVELFGFENHLEALINVIYRVIQIENIAFFTMIIPPIQASTLLSYEIRAYFRNSRWDMDQILSEVTHQIASLHRIATNENENYDLLFHKLHMLSKPLLTASSRVRTIPLRKVLVENHDPVHLKIAYGPYSKTLRQKLNNVLFFALTGDSIDNSCLIISETIPDLPKIASTPIEKITYYFSEHAKIVHNQYHKKEVLADYGYLKCILIALSDTDLETIHKMADREHFELIEFQTPKENIAMVLIKKNFMAIYLKLREMYHNSIRVYVELVN